MKFVCFSFLLIKASPCNKCYMTWRGGEPGNWLNLEFICHRPGNRKIYDEDEDELLLLCASSLPSSSSSTAALHWPFATEHTDIHPYHVKVTMPCHLTGIRHATREHPSTSCAPDGIKPSTNFAVMTGEQQQEQQQEQSVGANLIPRRWCKEFIDIFYRVSLGDQPNGMHIDRPTSGRRIEECFCCWLKRVNIVCRLNKKMKSYYPVLIQFSASLILNTLPNHLQLALKLIQSSSPRGAVAHGDLRPNDDATNTRPRNIRPTVDCGLAKILRLNMWPSLVNRMPPVAFYSDIQSQS